MAIKDKFTKKTKQNKKSQFIYLLVLPKFKISSPTAKERKTNIKSEKALLLESQQRRPSATGGCREPAGRMAR